MTANLDFTSGHNADYVEYLTDGADVLLLQECKDLTLADLLPAGWTSLQDTSSEAKAGSCIAVREGIDVGRSWLVKGCGEPPGGGMLPRWIACAQLNPGDDEATAISAHAPPPRYSGLQPEFNANVADVVNANPRPLVGADANMDIDKFAKALGPGMRAYGKQSGICLVSSVPLTDVEVDSWAEKYDASDHPCVWGTPDDG